MKELDIEAAVENLSCVLSFVDEQLASVNCPPKTQIKINTAVEELFTNIAKYAYYPKTGRAVIQVSITDEPLLVEITFIDNGKPYNPLSSPVPDSSLPLRQIKPGGRGIMIVKHIMDDVRYAYKETRNIVTIKKRI